MKFSIEQIITDIKTEDSGYSKYAYVDDDKLDGCFFIKIHSWDLSKKHPLFSSLIDKKIRVTVEVLD